jgi:hypothetical protein
MRHSYDFVFFRAPWLRIFPRYSQTDTTYLARGAGQCNLHVYHLTPLNIADATMHVQNTHNPNISCYSYGIKRSTFRQDDAKHFLSRSPHCHASVVPTRVVSSLKRESADFLDRHPSFQTISIGCNDFLWGKTNVRGSWKNESSSFPAALVHVVWLVA